MQRLLLFAKFWAAGQVKSRLGRAIGYAAAADIYRLFVEVITERFADLADERWLVVDVGEDSDSTKVPLRIGEFAQLAGPAWTVSLQGPGNLGDRLTRAMHYALQPTLEGVGGTPQDRHRVADRDITGPESNRVVILGSDTPNLPRRIVEQAFQVLETDDVVLGPSRDGGYYLVGARGNVPPLFENIEWSTPQVWTQTCARLIHSDHTWRALDEWYDIDEAEDLQRLLDDLKQLPSDIDPRERSRSLQLRQSIEMIKSFGKR